MPEKPWKQIIEESKAAGASYELLPDDDYDFVISKAEATKTKTGKDMIKVQAKVISGDHARRVLFPNFVLTYDNPTSMSIFLRQMKVLGLDEAYFAADPTVEKNAADLVGRVFRGRVKTKSDPKYRNGEPQNEIVNYATPSAEARQAALSVPTSNNPNPVASPSAGSSAPASNVPAPAAPPAPPAPAAVPTPAPETVAQAEPPVPPPAAPSSMPIPPPPPAPTF